MTPSSIIVQSLLPPEKADQALEGLRVKGYITAQKVHNLDELLYTLTGVGQRAAVKHRTLRRVG
jgi:hypothetical protein